MNLEIILVLTIIMLALYLFISEKLSIDTVSILVMALLIVTGILTPEEGFSGFSNSATITVTCMFVLSYAIFQTGAMNSFGKMLTGVGRRNEFLAVLVLMVVAAVVSAFINDTAVVALLMPVVIQASRHSGISPSRLLMPLSFGALLGGVCTLLGTSTNILVSGIAERMYLEPFGMFEMTKIGLIFLITGLAYMLIAGTFLMPRRKDTTDISETYSLGKYLTEIILLPKAKSVGQQILNCQLKKDLDIEILQVIRGGVILEATPTLVLEANDLLKVRCDVEKLKLLMEREGIKLKPEKQEDDPGIRANGLILIEAMVMHNSRFLNRSIKEINFRGRFDGANVIAIRHRDQILYERLGKAKLDVGDVLLISSNRERAKTLRDSSDFLVLSESPHTRFNFKKILPVIGIIAAVVLAASLGITSIVISATLGVLALVIFGIMRPDEVYKSIEWKVVFMLAGVLSMGAALEKTGAAELLSDGLINSVGVFGPHAVLSTFFLLTFMMTNFMSNNATAALLAPIAVIAARSLDVDERPFLMTVAFASSLSFMTPMGYQTNAMIYGPGNYKFKDYLVVGTPLNILLWIIGSIFIPYFFPF
jgi:di/tricarboxylate transporter